MNAALLIGSTALVVVLLAAYLAWRRRQLRNETPRDRYLRETSYLWSDRQVLRARRLARAEKRRRFWAAGSAGTVGGYYSNGAGGDGGGGNGGCGAGGCGGGGCGGGGCGGGGCGGGGS